MAGSRRRGPRTRGPAPFPGDTHDPDGLPAWCLRYLEHLRVSHRSPRGVDQRHKQLRGFVAWCLDRGLTTPHQITRPILQSYQRWLFLFRKTNGKPLGVGTQRNRLDAVRGLFRWLTREDVLLSNPASELEMPRKPQRLPRDVLTPEEAEAVLALPDTTATLGLRDRAMLEVFYATGIRRMELVALEVYDVDHRRETLRVREGKGNKERLVPLGERALWWVERYLSDARPELAYAPDPGVLFLNQDGQAFSLGGLTQLVRRYVKRADLGKEGSCHLFRHTCATAMLEGGADLRFIQEMLGHASTATTEVYTRVSLTKLSEIHRATHPGAQLRRPSDDEDQADASSP